MSTQKMDLSNINKDWTIAFKKINKKLEQHLHIQPSNRSPIPSTKILNLHESVDDSVSIISFQTPKPN